MALPNPQSEWSSADYDRMQQMIDASIDKELRDSSFADMSDVKDAVQSAASDAQSDIRSCESSIEDLERRISDLESED
jgi:polyhydroxyalkanoate synthesis regulator phasin